MEALTCNNAPKVDPRVRRTRKLIEDALRSLMAERAYASISVADIAERATVNRATFYAHFVDKDSLAIEMLRSEFEGALVACLPAKGTDVTTETVSDIATAVFEFVGGMRQNCPRTAHSLGEMVGMTLQNSLQNFISTGLEHSPTAMRGFPGASIETVSTVLAWSIYGGALVWSRSNRHKPAAGAAREIVALLFGLVRGPNPTLLQPAAK